MNLRSSSDERFAFCIDGYTMTRKGEMIGGAMQRSRWDGSLDLAGSARERNGIYEQWLNFLARHICSIRLEEKLPDAARLQVRARVRRAGDFTMARIVSTTDRYRLCRDRSTVVADSQDRCAVLMTTRGESEISQFARNQLLLSGSYAFFSTSEPSLVGSNGGDNDTIVFLMPREFIRQRVASPEDLCARPYSSGAGLQSLASDALTSLEKSAWAMNDDALPTLCRPKAPSGLVT
jgi:AraC-binding-like domain